MGLPVLRYTRDCYKHSKCADCITAAPYRWILFLFSFFFFFLRQREHERWWEGGRKERRERIPSRCPAEHWSNMGLRFMTL